MKLVVNTLLGVGMHAIAEAVALGEKAGLDRERLLEVLAKTETTFPRVSKRGSTVACANFTSRSPS